MVSLSPCLSLIHICILSIPHWRGAEGMGEVCVYVGWYRGGGVRARENKSPLCWKPWHILSNDGTQVRCWQLKEIFNFPKVESTTITWGSTSACPRVTGNPQCANIEQHQSGLVGIVYVSRALYSSYALLLYLSSIERTSWYHKSYLIIVGLYKVHFSLMHIRL